MTNPAGEPIAVVLGTRPEAIKLAPVILAMRASGLKCIVLSTGQHSELLHSGLAAFGLKADRDLRLMREGQSLGTLSARLIEGISQALLEIKPRLVAVQGDTATAFCGALAAFHLKLPCAHVEAGLRSGRLDAPWPEEAYRQMTDRICSRLYAPTEGARHNLLNEGLADARIAVTGQTGVDAALIVSRQTRTAPARVPALARDSRLIYATAHRRESHEHLPGMLDALVSVVRERSEIEIVLPLHPNPEVRRRIGRFKGLHPRLHLVDPIDYADSVYLLTRAALVVTDSGGLQEEAPSFGVPVLVTREVTERPEGVAAGFLRVVGHDHTRLAVEIADALDDAALRQRLAHTPNPYGDGHAANRIVADILRLD